MKKAQIKNINECREVIEDWRKSQLPISEYCRKHNIPLSSFRYYKQKVLKNVESVEIKKKFKEIDFSPSPVNLTKHSVPESTEINVSFGDFIKVTLADGFDSDEFSKVAKVLNGLVC